MGCGASRAAVRDVEDSFPRTISMLHLQEGLPKLVDLFFEMDTNGDGTISLVEFLDRIDLDRTKFIERAFGVMDSDGTGELNFREWVVAMWHFATLRHDELVGFFFDLYDGDGSDSISIPELERALLDAYGSKAAGRNVQQVLSKAAKRDASLTRKEFVDTIKSKSEMLYPAVQAQTQVRRMVVGTAFWERRLSDRLAERNPMFHPGRYRELLPKLLDLDLTAIAHRTASAKVEPAP